MARQFRCIRADRVDPVVLRQHDAGGEGQCRAGRAQQSVKSHVSPLGGIHSGPPERKAPSIPGGGRPGARRAVADNPAMPGSGAPLSRPHGRLPAGPPGALHRARFRRRPESDRPRHRRHAVGLAGFPSAAAVADTAATRDRRGPGAAGRLVGQHGDGPPPCTSWTRARSSGTKWPRSGSCLWLVMPAGLLAQLPSRSCLFRIFDAVKPGPVGWADALFHGVDPAGRPGTPGARPAWASCWTIWWRRSAHCW
jgi:hypothetical protein